MRKYGFTAEEAKRIFFTSDTHFHHANIIKYCNRPFKDIEEHDAELVKRWNEKVPEDGIVFHLGDFGFAHPQYINYILDSLHGKKFLIIGNHDWRRVVTEHGSRFEEMALEINMKIDGQHIILNHFPFLCYSGSYRGSWQLFGHVHTSPYSSDGLDNPRLKMLFPTQYDVGVDNNNFTPISYEEVKQIIEKQIWEQNSHTN